MLDQNTSGFSEGHCIITNVGRETGCFGKGIQRFWRNNLKISTWVRFKNLFHGTDTNVFRDNLLVTVVDKMQR